MDDLCVYEDFVAETSLISCAFLIILSKGRQRLIRLESWNSPLYSDAWFAVLVLA